MHSPAFQNTVATASEVSSLRRAISEVPQVDTEDVENITRLLAGLSTEDRAMSLFNSRELVKHVRSAQTVLALQASPDHPEYVPALFSFQRFSDPLATISLHPWLRQTLPRKKPLARPSPRSSPSCPELPLSDLRPDSSSSEGRLSALCLVIIG
jgi:hypothetical protein